MELARRLTTLALVGISAIGVAGGSVDAKGYVSTPSIDWLASTVPTASKIEMSRVVRIGSQGRRTWSTTGGCSVVRNRLVIDKTIGSCTVTLRLGATPRFAASTSRVTLQVRTKSELNVHVAASLTRVFTDLGSTFTSRFLNVSVKFNFAGSATLATQIQQGAPADVVVMADSTNMDKLVTTGDVRRADIADIARNNLAILVPRGNPMKISSLGDLSRSGLKIVLCDTSQPCGKYAASVLTKARVDFQPASREANASAVVARIANGEADAGVSYVTDGLVAGDRVDAVPIPDSLNVVANYPMAIVADPTSRDVPAIAAFVAMARGTEGDELLRRAGFDLP